MLGLAALTLAALSFVTAPYGRYARGGWGPTVPSRAGWIAMETPAVVAFVAFYLLGRHRAEPTPIALLALWQVHYIHRAFSSRSRCEPIASACPFRSPRWVSRSIC